MDREARISQLSDRLDRMAAPDDGPTVADLLDQVDNPDERDALTAHLCRVLDDGDAEAAERVYRGLPGLRRHT